MGSDDGVTSDNSYDFPNIYVTNQVSVGTKLKVRGLVEFTSNSGKIGRI